MSRALVLSLAVALAAPAAALSDRGRPLASVSSAHALVRVDVSGDGVRDTIASRGALLVVTTRRRRFAAHVAGRLDGTLHVPGVRGDLLLVRTAAGRDGVVDAVYRVAGERIERLRPHLFVTAIVGSAYLDIDCGAAPQTISQIALEPRGAAWRKTEATYALRGGRLVLVRATRTTVHGAEASHRRCAVVRR